MLKHITRRLGRWMRRTRWMLTQTLADLGLGGPHSPAWAWDNPFLFKTGLADLRRFRLGWRLAWTVGLLGAVLIGAALLARASSEMAEALSARLFGVSLPFAALCALAFVHATLIAGGRQAAAISLADEVRRGTLPGLLLVPLRRAEMVLAMGVGPARTAALTALVGLPIYVLLAQIGALSGTDVLSLLVLFLLICYAPPVYTLPARGGDVLSPETAQGQAASAPVRRPARAGRGAVVLPLLFGILTISPLLGLLGGWLGHLLGALGLDLPRGPLGRMLIVLAWPVYGAQVLGGTLPLFHVRVSPLPFLLVLLPLAWAASALETAAALLAGSMAEMARLPVMTRARTLARLPARLSALLALGVVWTAWVESGDTASLAGGTPGAGGWDAAGLLLGMGGVCLPAVWARGLSSPKLPLRRALGRGLRPLGTALVLFGLACGLGGLSPFLPPVGAALRDVAGTGAATVFWAWGLSRRLPRLDRTAANLLLFGFPVAMLSLPAPLPLLSALSPATAWLRLFPPLAAQITRLPWHPAAPPPLWQCLAGATLAGAVLAGMALSAGPLSRLGKTSVPQAKTPPVAERNPAYTKRLLAWAAVHSDNPLLMHELRARTRSGRWADWRLLAPALFAAAFLLGLTYPEVVNLASFLSPFHFFDPRGGLGSGLGGPPWANLAALTLSGECYFVAFRAPARGEALLTRDRQRGIWGFILLTPLTAGQIFRGKLLGQSAGPLAALGVFAIAALLFSLLSALTVGLGPALAAWAAGQGFALSLWLLGVSVGAALSSWPVFSRGLRGAAPLLFTGLAGLGLWTEFQFLPWDTVGGWALLAGRLGRGTAASLLLSAFLLLFAEWRIARLRRRDVAFGDGAG